MFSGLIEELLLSGLTPGYLKEDMRWLTSVQSAQLQVVGLTWWGGLGPFGVPTVLGCGVLVHTQGNQLTLTLGTAWTSSAL